MHITHVNLAKGFRGGERQTALLIAALAQQHIPQTLLVRHDAPLRTIVHGLPRLTIRTMRKPYLWQLKRPLATDMLHAHEAKAAQWAYLYHRLYGTPYMITRRVPNLPKNNVFTRAVYQHAAHRVALSRAIRDVLRLYQPGSDVRVIPSMYQQSQADPVRLHQLRQQYGKHAAVPSCIIGHMGALVRDKGQRLMIEAARTLQSSHPELLFLLVGDGPDKASLMQQAAGLKNVCFAGQQSQVADYFALFDVFVFPSLHEGLGSSLLDAIFHQLPIIASRTDGIVDVVQHEQTGLLIAPGNAAALAAAIVRLRAHPELCQRLVQQAHATLPRYAQHAVARQYQALYQDTVAV